MKNLSAQLSTAKYSLTILGVILVVGGLTILLLPGITLLLLAQLVAVGFVLGGVACLGRAMRTKQSSAGHSQWLAGGLLLLIGLLFTLQPVWLVGMISTLIGLLLALWGALALASSRLFAAGSRDRLSWITSGIIGLTAALIILLFPFGSAQLFVWIIGGSLLLTGISLLVNLPSLQTLRQNPRPKRSRQVIDL